MPTNTRTLQEMQEEMEQDAAAGWVKVAHWTFYVDKDVTKHLIIKSRTIVREYVVDWTTHRPVVTDMPAEYSAVGSTVKSAELKEMGYKRNKGTVMLNEVTREMANV